METNPIHPDFVSPESMAMKEQKRQERKTEALAWIFLIILGFILLG